MPNKLWCINEWTVDICKKLPAIQSRAWQLEEKSMILHDSETLTWKLETEGHSWLIMYWGFWCPSSSPELKKVLNSSFHLPFWQVALKYYLSWASLSLSFLFSCWTTCLGPCPLGKWEWNVTHPARKSTCPCWMDSTFFRALLKSSLITSNL